MNFSDPIAWYAHHQAQQQKTRIDNQKILFRRLFDNAVNEGLIEFDHGSIIAKAEPGRVVAHFNHHPDLFQTIPFNYNYLCHDKDALERTLNEAWRQTNTPI